MLISKNGLLIIVLIAAGLGAILEHQLYKHPQFSQSKDEQSKQENNVVTIIKERKAADGSSTVETKIVDKTKKSETSSEMLVISMLPNWMVYGTVNLNRSYGLGMQRRILGNLFIGAYGDTEQRFGASLGYLF